MKLMIRILSVILTLCLMAGVSFSASAYVADLAEVALDLDVPDEVHTEVSFADGSVQDFAAAPDIEEIDESSYRDEIEGYQVFVNSKAVLDVDFSGLYSAEFMIPGTTKYVFLAGLTADNIEETQQRIINSYSGIDYMLSLEDLSFIDTEKTKRDQNDDSLCWAASCANILSYTGWGAKAGFETEDDIMDAFVEGFSDEGSIVQYALGWFFNGVNTFERITSGVATVNDYGNSGGFLNDYAYDRQTGHKDIYTDCTGIGEALQALKMGCGVAVGVEVFINGSHVGGHEVTMWGAVTNEAYSPDEAAYYDMIIISDSDSDKNDYSYTDRRQAKNEYDLYRLSYFEGTAYGEQCTSLSYYDGVNVCMLYDYDYLIPYSDDIETETDAQATKNKTTTPDAAVRKVFLSDSETGGEFTDEFMLGDTVYITPTIENVGDYVFTCSSGHKLTATISGTNWSAQKTFRSTLRPSTLITMFTFSASGLKKGDYTLTVQFDADRRVEGAYYYNNTYTMDFSVVTDPTKYLSGDTDDDWDISVLDATKIQKILAMIEADPDGKCSVRGDVFGEGLNILSATAIQKYLANLDYGAADIGSIKSYETGDA